MTVSTSRRIYVENLPRVAQPLDFLDLFGSRGQVFLELRVWFTYNFTTAGAPPPTIPGQQLKTITCRLDRLFHINITKQIFALDCPIPATQVQLSTGIIDSTHP